MHLRRLQRESISRWNADEGQTRVRADNASAEHRNRVAAFCVKDDA